MIQLADQKNKGLCAVVFLSCVLCIIFLLPTLTYAICATVKIEIQQELTLERQAFNAHMRINNGLSDIPIEDVAVTVNFADETRNPVVASADPSDTAAVFFIRIDSMDKIDNVDGNGSVAPGTSADINWLIIPSPGASKGLANGTLYYVGATLTYTVAGKTESVEVSPDYIFVKPMPQLVLDYFLPTDVYGDDAHTQVTEPAIPFSLGLRVSNKGDGYARALKIESAQPKIVDNDRGLLIGFQIEGSAVNGSPATQSLLADFGDIAPHSAGTARWTMSCSMSGQFVEFGADFSHADELGGQLTSLIAEDDVNTHFLIHDVLVDAEGRDNIQDFLARDGEVVRVYESDNTETVVADQTAVAAMENQGGNTYKITTPVTSGFIYAKIPDPGHGSLVIKQVMRSDGKFIKPDNAWQSKTRTGNDPWQYFVNIFDYNTPGSYTVIFQSPADVPQAPVIAYIPERARVEGEHISFLVEAADPNGTAVSLSAERMPIGSSFVDQGGGTGIFSWVPINGQAGRYAVKFNASDGVLESSRQAVITILSVDDTDGDGMLDSWEMEQFGTLDRDGNGDFDGDGISDMDEYLYGFDPTAPDSAPTIPEIIFPLNGEHVDQISPELEILNSIDPEGDAFTYTFELYADKEFNDLIASQADAVPQIDPTTWTVPAPLEDNASYYWRVKAQNVTGSSNWAYGWFFVNTWNDPPTAPEISYPADSTSVDSPTPVLEVTNSTDPDQEELSYTFEVYTDIGMTERVDSGDGSPHGDDGATTWTVTTPLEDNTGYYWRAIAVDGSGAQTPGPLSFIIVDTLNQTPGKPDILQPVDESETVYTDLEISAAAAEDPDGDQLSYVFELDTAPTFDSAGKRISEAIAPDGETVRWHVPSLSDNTKYYWRVKADDGGAHSRWAVASFFVNTVNDTPSEPRLKNPADNAWVGAQTPQPAVHGISDPDGDDMFYRFEIFTDADLTQPIRYTEIPTSVWTDMAALETGKRYFWRYQTVDEHGVAGQWSDTATFFVKLNSVDLPPRFVFNDPAEAISTNDPTYTIRWSDTDPDSNAVMALYYDTDSSGEDGILIVENLEEDPDDEGADAHTWDVSSLEGLYYLYAVISDGTTSETVYCPATVTIDHTAPAVTVDPASGNYAEAVAVTLSTDESAQIYYTLDGSDPTIESNIYLAPISVDEDTTIRIMAVDAAGNASGIVAETYTFGTTEINVRLSTDKGRQLDGVRVYAFTDAGAYTGKNATSSDNGEANFHPDDFSTGNYKFRVDYLGQRIWSDIVVLPDSRSIDVIIAEEPVTILVGTAAGISAGVRVYLFSSSGQYLGQYLTTDANGQVTFDLPVGIDFTFRADLYGTQYWSEVTTVQSSGGNSISVNTGGGHYGVEVVKRAAAPISGIRVYLFSATGSYLGHYATTDDTGHAGFDVPAGDYKIRTDYLGYQFWSADTTVSTDTQQTLVIPHQQSQVSVEIRFQSDRDPIENVNTYLFTGAGQYLSVSTITDSDGKVFLDLPQQAYKVRADYMGQQIWSPEFTWQDPVVTIPMSDVQVTVTGAGAPLQNVNVYLFTAAGSYLGTTLQADTAGQVRFRVPEGDYKFRADYQGNQYWSTEESLAADQLHNVGISTGGGSFEFTLWEGQGQPLGNVKCYVFDENDHYLGLQGVTDAAGQVSFDLADGTYKIRVDHRGHQFWSEAVHVPDLFSTELIIPHSPTQINVVNAGRAAENVRVYLFSGDGAYLGQYMETDAQGNVLFDLPVGVDFIFRADLFGRQYWSEVTVIPQTSPAQVIIDSGGGRLHLTVDDGSGNPMADRKVYLFSESNAYLDVYGVTDTAGSVFFDLSAGTYKLRVDYLGYHFWTGELVVDQDMTVTLPIDHQDVEVNVQGGYMGTAQPLAGIEVYLFTPTGSFLGQQQTTAADGRVSFNLPHKDYMARVDYMGLQYWSESFKQQNTAVIIPMADVQVTVTGAGLPREEISVYLFSPSDAYLGSTAKTDGNGQVSFRLPAGSYKFRADYQGNPYWSGLEPLVADQSNPVVVSVGGGTFTLNIRQDQNTPMIGVRGYVFNDGDAYIGLYGATDAQGRLHYDLADGTFKFRVDYLGYTYWSDTVTVPDHLETHVEIPHQQMTFTLSGNYLSSNPLGGIKLYLFSADGKYMGIQQTTGSGGQASFLLPDREYKVRADYLGEKYWSSLFRSQDAGLDIPHGAVELHAHNSGIDAEGVRMYLFNASGSYLGRYELTDLQGRTRFILPSGTYRFRADTDGIQKWSPAVIVTAGQGAAVDMDLDQ